ncbi:MAG: AMP-binding protein, partial [Verrucomicrobia bacterium]|nr:AMP-binding protein [Verrucomicrobiota bacterium]
FEGYLDDPGKTKAAFRDGWFITGDLGRFDQDGFLFIEGRVSRFSKIGGEMVPHGTVEAKIIEAFGWETAEAPVVFVAGMPDAAKGESLILLSTQEIAPEALRAKLTALGVPNLWVPKIIRRVDRIPMLGTGKTDLKQCRELALEAAK